MKLEMPAKAFTVFVLVAVLAAGCSGGGSSGGEGDSGSSGGGEQVVVGEGGVVGGSGGGGVVSGGDSGEGDGAEEVVGLLDSSGCSDGSWLEDSSVGAVSDCEALVGLRNRIAGGRVRSEVPRVFDGVDGDEFWVWGNSSVDRWRGVELDEDGRVVRLELWLGGEFEVVPEEIVELSELRDLILSAGGVSGALPVGFGGLSKLEKLFFDRSSFTEIPSEVFGLGNLRDFRVGGEIGRIPAEIGGLASLEVLNLGRNHLSGEIPVELGSLDELSELYLTKNNLSGSIPAELGNLSNLTQLGLSNNELSGVIPSELGNLVNLEDLALWNNDLCGEVPEVLYRLDDFDISDNPRLGFPCDEDLSDGSP